MQLNTEHIIIAAAVASSGATVASSHAGGHGAAVVVHQFPGAPLPLKHICGCDAPLAVARLCQLHTRHKGLAAGRRDDILSISSVQTGGMHLIHWNMGPCCLPGRKQAGGQAGGGPGVGHLSEAKMRTSSTLMRMRPDPRISFQLSITCRGRQRTSINANMLVCCAAEWQQQPQRQRQREAPG